MDCNPLRIFAICFKSDSTSQQGWRVKIGNASVVTFYKNLWGNRQLSEATWFAASRPHSSWMHLWPTMSFSNSYFSDTNRTVVALEGQKEELSHAWESCAWSRETYKSWTLPRRIRLASVLRAEGSVVPSDSFSLICVQSSWPQRWHSVTFVNSYQ